MSERRAKQHRRKPEIGPDDVRGGKYLAPVLITLWTGRKPTKRTFEMLCFYFSGWANGEDLAAHIERLAETEKTK